MQHLGDITRIDGHTAPAVDVVIGGSPCQDLSIAGKRDGLAGARSGLFMEQIRIVREMREEDRKRGTPAHLRRPRFMVWENVPGAFSSNKGEDFRAVLEEIIRIAEPDAPDIPLPPKGKWPLADAYYGDGWSVAYRVCDAKFWGVPQRRRRIHLVADFGGRSAPWILFVHKSLSGDLDTLPQAGEAAAGGTGGGTGKTVSLRIRGGCAGGGGKGALITEEASGTLSCNNDQTIFCHILPFDTTQITSPQNYSHPHYGDPCHPLAASAHHPAVVISFKGGAGAKAGGVGAQKEESPTLTAAGSGTNRVPLVYAQQKFGDYKETETAATLTAHNGTRHTGEVLVLTPTMGVDCRNGTETPELSPTLQAHESGGTSLNATSPIRIGTIVRRLTPLECERLQGYPDGWTVLPKIEDMSDAGYEFWKAALLEKAEREGKVRLSEAGAWEVWRFTPGHGDGEGSWENTHKPYKHKTKEQMVEWYNRSFCEDTDSARYKAMGNSIALPSWRWVLKRISAMYEWEATLAPLFDGVGGFPLIWEQINGKGSCLWASEIELFPIAVTRYRFGGYREETAEWVQS